MVVSCISLFGKKYIIIIIIIWCELKLKIFFSNESFIFKSEQKTTSTVLKRGGATYK